MSAPGRLVVLVVGSAVLTSMRVADTLAEAGYRVVVAASTDHALVVLGVRADIRLAVIDVGRHQPGMDGTNLAREIASGWPHIRTIVVAGPNNTLPDELPQQARLLAQSYSGADLTTMVDAMLTEV